MEGIKGNTRSAWGARRGDTTVELGRLRGSGVPPRYRDAVDKFEEVRA